jgi:hypothetical protein
LFVAIVGFKQFESMIKTGGKLEKVLFTGELQGITRGAIVASSVYLGFQLLPILLFLSLGSFDSAAFSAVVNFGLVFGFLALIKKIRNETHVLVYEDRVETGSNFIRHWSRRFEASKIESVDVQDSLLGGKLYGYVIVKGSGGAKLPLAPIKNVQELAESIRKISSAPQSKSANSKSSSSSTTGNLVSDLQGLEKLKSDGVISEAEFQELKKKAISGQ